MELEYIVTSKDNNKTIKDILLNVFKISHRLLITLKKENAIFLNNIPAFLWTQVCANDKVTIFFSYLEDNSNIIPKKMALDIVYEDECYLVINKPAGIPVHPSMLHYEDSLSNGVRYYFDTIGLHKKIRPVNRLDRNTSGLVIFAKNEYIQECLIRQMKNGFFKKEYIAIVEGHFSCKKGTVDAPIARKENSIIERCVSKDGQKSVTHYKVLTEKVFANTSVSVVHCTLETGRTHQIRVHMAYLGHPLLGDDLYGSNTNFIKRQALHSCTLSFIHPITKQSVKYSSFIPDDLKVFL